MATSGAQQQLEGVSASAMNQEIRQDPPLRRAPCRKMRRPNWERFDIVGELSLQKRDRVGAGHAKQGQGRQVAENGAVACGCQLGRRVAEARGDRAIERGTSGAEEIGPGAHWGGRRGAEAAGRRRATGDG